MDHYAHWSRRGELMLKALTHNIMTLLRVGVFYRALQAPFGAPSPRKRHGMWK